MKKKTLGVSLNKRKLFYPFSVIRYLSSIPLLSNNNCYYWSVGLSFSSCSTEADQFN